MEGFPRLCHAILLVANVVALIKSVEFTFVGATLIVLDPVARSALDLDLYTSDLEPDLGVTWAELYQLLGKFLLITGPVIFVTAIGGLVAAYRKSSVLLACYLGLLVTLIAVVLALCAIGIPRALLNPNDEWRPLSDFMLTSIVILLAMQGLMIFFTFVLMTTLTKEESQVTPRTEPKKKEPPSPRPFAK